MRQLLRYLWDDAYSCLAIAGTSIGVLVGFLPMLVPDMPSSYGWWIAGICGAGLLYRAMKAAVLLRFGRHTAARIAEQSATFKGISNLTYYFRIESVSDAKPLHFTIHGKWDTSSRHSELSVAYWKSYPNFHIAYWNYNTKKQTAEKKPSESQLLDTKLQQIMKMLEQEATRQRSEPSGEYTLETLVRSMVRSETWGDGHGLGLRA